MATLQTRLSDLITSLGTDWKNIWAKIGNGTLNTTAQNLVAAINEVKVTADAAGGSGTLDDLSDVVISSPATGHIVRHNGTNWVNVLGSSHFQPVDSDLTSIAALTTTSYGRAILELADAAALTALLSASSETVSGRIEIATQGETNTGTDDVRAVTPLKFQTRLAAYAQPLDSDLTSIAALTTTSYGRAFLELANQAALMGLISSSSATAQGIVELATDAETITGTDTARATTPANIAALFTDRIDTNTSLGTSNTKVPSQNAVKAYADALIGANDAMVFKGVIDASANPNYPASNRGDTYRISVAGKIGGGSGPNVEVGDLIIALTDGTAAGTHASVGAQWNIVQSNIDGAVTGPASATSANLTSFNGTSGKIVQDSGFSASNSAIGAGSATILPTSAQVVAYAQPIDSDLTAIAALTTTSYGRAFLALADTAALMALLSSASETVQGKIEIATQAETNTGTDDVRAVTPLKFQTRFTALIGDPDTDLAALYTTAKA